MAVTDQQKLDFLLKKIGYTKTKTGSVVGTGAISGTPKQPFAEAIPSPLVVPNSSLWNEAGSIPATAPGSDTPQVKVYLAATSGLRMTADSTSSGQRAYIAYSTYGNTSSTRLTNWIDTQFGASYLIKVYKGDPNSGGVALSAAGSGANDGWFFDYSAGVLNFNDTSVPSGVTDTNIYIVGYRYTGQTGAPTSGISTFSNLDLTVERNLDVGKQGGISTFREGLFIPDDKKLEIGNAAGNGDLQFYYDSTPGESLITHTGPGVFKIEGNTSNNIFIRPKSGQNSITAKPNAEVELYYNGVQRFETTSTGVSITGNSVVSGNVSAVDATFTGNVSIAGTLTYEDVKNVDAVGLITARSGIRVTGGVIEAQAGENKIPSLYAAMGNLPSAGSYHGMFAHVHATGRGYFAHAGNWLELVNREINGVVGTGTETYNIGNLVSTSSTATSLNVTGVTTAVTLDVNGDLDVDGHTNLDNVNIVGVSTFDGNIDANGLIEGTSGENKIPSLYANLGALPSPVAYHGMFAHVHATGRGYFAHAGNWLELVNKETNGTVGTGTETFNIGSLTATAIDLNGDLDVDGHTNLDNVSIAGVTTIANTYGYLYLEGLAPSVYFKDTSSGTPTFRLMGEGGQLYVQNTTNPGNSLIINTATNLATFSGGVDVDDFVDVGSNIQLGNAGVITATTFKGDGDFVELDVDGHTNLDNVSVAGVTTFAANTRFDSTITAGGSAGSNGQYLKSTGSGVAWDTFPSLRTRQTFTASSGQTTFSFAYTIGFLDVYVNGIKLTDAEFTATNGSTTVLAVGCFVGDIVELVAYNTVSASGSAFGIGNLVEDLSPQLGGNLDLFNKSITGTGNVNITGVVTATKFVGDGSGLSGIVASGSGVVIKDSGSLVGTAGTINFGNNLSVSAISGGSVTITASGGGGGTSGINTIGGVVNIVNDLDVDGHTNLDNVSIAGVVTATTFVGALTGNATGLSGNPSINVTDLDVDGHTNLDNVSVTGVTTFSNGVNVSSGQLTVATSIKKTSGTLDINANTLSLNNAAASATYAVFSNGGSALLKWNNTDRLETTTSGVTVTGTVAATSYTGDGSQLTGITAGISTISGVVNIVNDLDVDGHTNLDNVSIAGVTTFAGAIDLNADLDVDGHTNLDNVTIAGVCTATNFVGDGSGLTNVIGSGSGVVVKDSGSTVGTAGTINFADGLDVTDISAGIVTVSTATTSIISGDSKVFVNDESTTTNNGSFEVLLSDVTSSGVAHTAFRIYSPSANSNSAEFFHNNNQIFSSLALKATYGGNTNQAILFRTNNANFSGNLSHSTAAGQFNFYNTYNGTQYNPLVVGTTVIFTKANVSPLDNNTYDLGTSSAKYRQFHTTGVNAGVVTATTYYGDGSNLTGISGGGGTNVGITTNLSGTFTASAGTPATINTFAYHDNDKVVEYTVYIKNGSDFQSQKLLAMRDGTTIHSTQFAVMFSSSLLVQCDATISSGNILLRATPETGVSGSTTYKIKREVM